MVRITALAAAALLAPAAAQADWHRAESRHYIVYGDNDAATVRAKAEKLEKLDMVQHALTGVPDTPATVKMRVYLLSTNARVQATMASGNPWVAGYYGATVRGPHAVSTDSDDKLAHFSAQLVLFHELTHHFVQQYSRAAYPVWYSEGFADFIGSTTIESGNVVTIGAPVDNRYFSLRGRRGEDWIAVEKLLIAHDYAAVGDRLDLLYAEGWLLTHYLTLSGERQGQLGQYLSAINAGRSYKDAAKVFGSLTQLNSDLKHYAARNKLPVKVITFKKIDPGSITVSPVPAAQAALMTADIMMDAGVLARNAPGFAATVRKTAASFPRDPFALRMRVEADWLADERDDRAAALAQWAAIAPRDPTLLHHQALLAIDLLGAAKETNADKWEAVRRDLLVAHKLAPNDPSILKSYYDSYVMQGAEPTPGAQNALFRALDIVPQDDEVRYALAAAFEARGLYKDALTVIAPAAFAVDDSKTGLRREADAEKRRMRFRLARQPMHETARAMLNRLEQKVGAAAPEPVT